jgi:hypothetical protein
VLAWFLLDGEDLLGEDHPWGRAGRGLGGADVVGDAADDDMFFTVRSGLDNGAGGEYQAPAGSRGGGSSSGRPIQA